MASTRVPISVTAVAGRVVAPEAAWPRRVEDRHFRPDVEGLRAIAVLLVVLFHANISIFAGGYVGVDVFFVLSGFLITGLLIRERVEHHTTSLPHFYARRVRRILPAATLVLVVTVLAAYQWLGFLRAGAIARDGQWTAFFAANIGLAVQGTQYLNNLDLPSPLQHYWSLAVEEQFYLVWPVLMLLLWPARSRHPRTTLAAVLAAIVVASFAWSVIQTASDSRWAFFSPFTRAWELGVGAMLAIGMPLLLRAPVSWGVWLSWGGLAMIVVSGVVLNADTPFPGYAAALPVGGAALAIAGGSISPGQGAERVLATGPLQWLGKLSYSLYLWHWPVLAVASEAAGALLSLTQTVALLGIALALSIATFSLWENPIRRSEHLNSNMLQSLALGVVLVVASVALCSWEIQIH